MIDWPKAPYLERCPDETVIWRYLPLEKYLNLLSSHSLYFSRIDQFEDKAEGLVTNREVDYWEQLYNSDIKSWMAKMKKKVFVNCWISSEHEVSTMWGAYNASIAIKSTIGNLRKCYHGELDVVLAKVKYIDYDRDTVQPAGEPINAIRFFSTKRIFYSSENEIRLIHEPTEDVDTKGIIIPIDLKTLIKEVHCSPSSSNWLIETVREASVSFGLSSPIVNSDLLYNE